MKNNAEVVTECLLHDILQFLETPLHFSDMNPIANMCTEVKKKVRGTLIRKPEMLK